MKKQKNEAQLKTTLLCVGVAIVGFGIGFISNNPKTIPVLKNGEEVVAKIDGKEFTANDLYNKFKEEDTSTVLLNLIDSYIAEVEVDNDEEANEYAKSYLSNIKAQYELYGYDFEEALTEAGYKDEEAFIKDIADDHLLTLAAEKYIKENEITEEEINSYYETDVTGEMHVRYILVTPETTDDMTDEQKAEAEATALAEANEVISKLKNGEDFAELASKHSDDASTSSQGGLFDGFVKSDVVEEFWNAAVALEDGKYTTTPVESSYGYFVILRISQDEKPAVEDVKDEILENLLTTKASEDEDYVAKAWIKLRKNYNFEIIDSEIEKKYESLVDSFEK